MLRDRVQITGMGRPDESNGISASQLTLTLKNDGRFTPKNASAPAPYLNNILRNTQIRVSVNATSATGVAYSQYRFFGEISSWPPATDISGRDTYVSITAAGIWQRIVQSSATIGSPYSRYAGQQTGVNVPASYWAMEDGSGSTVLVTDVGAGAAATFTGVPSFAADGTSFAGSDALMQFAGARVTANVTSAATPTNTVVRFALSVPAAGDSEASTFAGGAEVAKIFSPSATIKRVDVSLVASQLQIHGYTSTAGGAAAFSGTITTKVNGVPVLVSVELTPSGSSVNWALRIIKPGAAAALDQVTGTRASSTLAAVTQVFLDGQGRLADTSGGHLGVFYAVPSLVTAAAALGGFAGEFAVDRFNRLCGEFGIATTVIGSTSAAMGPQADDTLANILQSIEDTDGGLLYETRDQFGLGYRTLISLQNQSVAVTLNYTAGVLGAPPAPTYDLQLVKNSWAVTNTDGYVAQATLTSGAVSVQQTPNGVGVYAGTANCNASTHAQVNAIAQQRLFTGTVDDVRYPTVTMNMARAQAAPLFASVPGLRIGDYMQVTTLPATVGGSSTSKQLAWGYAETISHNSWTIVFNAVPESPFETGYSPGVFSVVQAATQGVAAGSAVGSTVSGSQIAAGAVGGAAISNVISARSVGGVTSFIAASTPFDWSFAVSGTPTDDTFFICTEDQALPIAVGDTFTNSGGLGGPFTVTSLDPPSGGNVSIHYTPDASGVMSSGTVSGGKNGDTWVNTSAGNQVNQWANGAWVPVQFGPSATGNTGAVQNDNPYFAAGDPTGWSGFNGSFAVTASPPAGASYPYAGVYVNNGVTAGAMEEGDTNGSGFAVTPLTQISISGWFRSTSTTIQIGFDYANAAFGFVAGPTNQNFTVTANTWTQLTAVQTVPATAAWARPRIGCSTANGSTTYAQAVVCSQQVPGTLIQAGTVTAAQILAGTITAGLLAAGAVIAGKIAAGAIDGMTITGANIIADGNADQLLIYSGAPSSSNLIANISGAAGTDGFGTAIAAGVEIQQGGLVLDDQAGAPTAVSGASVLYSSIAGRPRYLSGAGADDILERGSINVATFPVGNTVTPTIISAPIAYLAGEGSQSSSFELEFWGNLSMGATVETPGFWLYIDGAAPSGNSVVSFGGASLIASNGYDYHVKMLVAISGGGASGHISIVGHGTLSAHNANEQYTGTGGINLCGASQVTGLAFDTTANHTIQAYLVWGGAGGQNANTYVTKIVRYS
jgi:hypothetical protein